MKISKIRHPQYMDYFEEYCKWRLTYKGGKAFIDKYLQKFSKREDDVTFRERKCLTYSPSFAKAGINKLKNTFYSRMGEIVRTGGPDSYISACRGEGGGVDLYGSSINSFMGQEVLKELMTMKTVGIWVDKPTITDKLLINNIGKKPYLYIYTAEDILSWNYTYARGEYNVNNILLRETNYAYDEKTGLALGIITRYRHAWIGLDGAVHIQFYIEDPDNEEEDKKDGEEVILNLNRVPFVPGGLVESLLSDVSDYQIGLLNIASADMNYCYKANFPFYTEQFDQLAQSTYTRRPPVSRTTNAATGKDPNEGTFTEAQRNDDDEMTVGGTTGRRYPKGTDRPEFIAPPTEPLIASMKKQEQMKQEIFELIDIAASNAKPQFASAESKSMDDRGLESGLSYIGLELEYMEREIAKIWALYEGGESASIKYPEKYSLKTDEQRNKEAEQLNKVKVSVPSRTFSKEVSKEISRVMLSDKIKNETIDKIEKEIEASEYISSDPELIKIASQLGMLDAVTGSNALGFDGAKVVPKAQEEHAKRLALIAQSQASGAARGNPDASTNQDSSAKDEKIKSQNSDTNADPGGRGKE
jgi:hypothetical protein